MFPRISNTSIVKQVYFTGFRIILLLRPPEIYAEFVQLPLSLLTDRWKT
jgi:hypothetical protein